MADQIAAPVTEAPATAATPDVQPEGIKPGEKVYEIKYPDGRTEKRGESWMLERAQKSVGLEKRVSDADKYEKAFTSFVSKVQDPTQLLELLNHPDLKYDDAKQEALMTAIYKRSPKMAEAIKRTIYENEVLPSLMDPKDRRIMELEKKDQATAAENERREKAAKEQEEVQKVTQIKDAYRAELGKAYRESGLPVDDFIVRQVMEKARLYVRAGKNPDFANCCKLVQNEFIGHVKGVLGKATVDNILTLMDGETPQMINKALMKALDKKDESPVDPSAPKLPRPKKKTVEKTPEEKKKWLRNLERGIVD